MPEIFISYRRDSITITGRIYERLVKAFGKKRIFRDIDEIDPGVSFENAMLDAAAFSKVMLVIIGPSWASITDEQGNKRLNDCEDPVRLEVEMGLRLSTIKVIPVLIDDAQMPHEEDLPKSLQRLVSLHGIWVRNDPDFDDDMETLISAIQKYVPQGLILNLKSWHVIVGGLVALIIILVAALLLCKKRLTYEPPVVLAVTPSPSPIPTDVPSLPAPSASSAQIAFGTTETLPLIDVLTATETPSPTQTFTLTSTPTLAPTDTKPPTSTPTPTLTNTPTLAPTDTETPTSTPTATLTYTATPVPTPTPQACQIAPSLIMDCTFVNNAEFASFVKRGGYREEAFWSQEGLEWLENNRGRLSGETGPADRWSADDPDYGSYPRVGIAFFEAEAYCNSIGKRLPYLHEWEEAQAAIAPNKLSEWEHEGGEEVKLGEWVRGADDRPVIIDSEGNAGETDGDISLITANLDIGFRCVEVRN